MIKFNDLRPAELRGELHAALERMDFELHYGPVADLNAGRIAGLESLIRRAGDAPGRRAEEGAADLECLLAAERERPPGEEHGSHR